MERKVTTLEELAKMVAKTDDPKKIAALVKAWKENPGAACRWAEHLHVTLYAKSTGAV